jgi:hypothetical protein
MAVPRGLGLACWRVLYRFAVIGALCRRSPIKAGIVSEDTRSRLLLLFRRCLEELLVFFTDPEFQVPRNCRVGHDFLGLKARVLKIKLTKLLCQNGGSGVFILRCKLQIATVTVALSESRKAGILLP